MNTYCPAPSCLKGLNVIVGAIPGPAGFEREKALYNSGVNALVISFALGVVLGTVGGALVWPAHRVAGALIGGLIVGPVVGGTVGGLIAKSKMQAAMR